MVHNGQSLLSGAQCSHSPGRRGVVDAQDEEHDKGRDEGCNAHAHASAITGRDFVSLIGTWLLPGRSAALDTAQES